MESDPKQTVVILADGGLATWNFQKGLILLKTDSTDAQWNPTNISVKMHMQDQNVKVGLFSLNGSQYQNWYFNAESYLKLLTFFQSLGFPCRELTEL